MTNVSISDLTIEDFSPLIGSTFKVSEFEGDASFGSMELTEVGAIGRVAFDKRLPFRLLFRGPKDLALMQGMVTMEHDTLGRLDLFIVAVAANAEARSYEAIFT